MLWLEFLDLERSLNANAHTHRHERTHTLSPSPSLFLFRVFGGLRQSCKPWRDKKTKGKPPAATLPGKTEQSQGNVEWWGTKDCVLFVYWSVMFFWWVLFVHVGFFCFLCDCLVCLFFVVFPWSFPYSARLLTLGGCRQEICGARHDFKIMCEVLLCASFCITCHHRTQYQSDYHIYTNWFVESLKLQLINQ